MLAALPSPNGRSIAVRRICPDSSAHEERAAALRIRRGHPSSHAEDSGAP